MPLSQKIRDIQAGKRVRPPKRWWVAMYRRVSRQYSTFGRRRKAKIVAGIWHRYTRRQQIGIIRRIQKGYNGVP